MGAAEKSPSDSSAASNPPPPPSPPSRPSNKSSSSSSSSSNKPVQARLPAALASAPCRVDAFLIHLSRCMQTRSGAETVLLFACYATRLSASLLEGAGGLAIRQAARRLVARAYKLPPASTVVLSTTVPRSSLAAAALQVGMRLRVLSGMISETRTMARLWGLLGLYGAVKKMLARQTKQESEHKGDAADADADAESTCDTLVAAAQLASLVVFQATENVAFLSSKKVLPVSPASQTRLGLLSVRAWGLYVAIEAARLLVERSRKQSSLSTSSSSSGAEKKDWQAQWNKSFYRNLAWAPLTLHWGSATGGFLPDVAISLLAFYPALGAMMDLWKETRS
ncbi:hypothetical protein E4U21_007685 [Claviceps maximensis]|nr:hypothetical protein E4U21_007685 [Claviceps maximensis]